MLPLVSQSYAVDTAALRQHQTWFWLYATNIQLVRQTDFTLNSGYISLNHLWSLAVEEQFYLVWPMVIFCLGYRGLLITCAAACCGALAFRLHWGSGSAIDNMRCFALTTSRMDALACGAIVALWTRRDHPIAHMRKKAFRTALVAGCAVLVIGFHGRGWAMSDPYTRTFGLSALAICFAAFLTLILTSEVNSLVSRCLGQPWLRAMGKYSYGIYIYHALLLPEFLKWFERHPLPRLIAQAFAGQIVEFASCTAISFLLAALSWHLFEEPFLRLKRFFANTPQHTRHN